jgi:hypothetical protein
MLDSVQSLPRLSGHLGQARPDQKGAGDVVALDSRFPALAALKPSQLFGFSVKLLNLPTPGAHCVCIRRFMYGALFQPKRDHSSTDLRFRQSSHLLEGPRFWDPQRQQWKHLERPTQCPHNSFLATNNQSATPPLHCCPQRQKNCTVQLASECRLERCGVHGRRLHRRGQLCPNARWEVPPDDAMPGW